MIQIAYALAAIAVAGLAWDAARRWMTLLHGRYLNADKQGQFERELTAISTRLKRTDGDALALATRINEIEAEQLRVGDLHAQMDSLNKSIEKNNAAVVNVAEEVVKLKEKEALALQGVMSVPKKGLRFGQPGG